jgi:hypothetical protein
MDEQHDDHTWLVFMGEAWAIERMVRNGNNYLFHLWRGYWPNLQRLTIEMEDPDWNDYCKFASAMLQEYRGIP